MKFKVGDICYAGGQIIIVKEVNPGGGNNSYVISYYDGKNFGEPSFGWDKEMMERYWGLLTSELKLELL